MSFGISLQGVETGYESDGNTHYSRIRLDVLFSQRVVRRLANDNIPYTYHEFVEHYGERRAGDYWANARHYW